MTGLRVATLALAFLVTPTGAAAGATFTVSPTGSDANAGTAAAPFRTLARAQRAARAATPRMREDVVVVLRGGLHRLSEPLVLDARDSGRNGRRVVWRAAEGEQPVVSGGVRVTGWEELGGGLWRARVGSLATRQLYVDGVRAVRARGTLPGLEPAPGGYRATGPRIDGWRNVRDVELVYRSIWTEQRGQIASVADGLVRMREPFFTNARLHGPTAIGLPAWIENARELLDEPGEWYLDRRAGELLYLPRPGENLPGAEVVAPVLEALVRGRGTLARPLHDVSFEGITFADATWLGPDRDGGFAAIQANFALTGRNARFDGTDDEWTKMPAAVTFGAARRIRLAGNRFVRLGGAGLNLERGTKNSEVVGNELADVSGTGIQLGEVSDHHPRDARMVVSGNVLRNNSIHDVAVEYAGGVGIWAGYVARTSIEHNELSQLPYTAISLGWGWGSRDLPGRPTPARGNRVVANSIRDYLRVLRDGGGVYVLGSQPGLVVAGNVIVGQGGPGGALYLDDGARHATVERNVVFASGQWPYIFKGRDHVIRGNYWDFHSDYGLGFLESGTVEGNRVIAALEEAPAEILADAGPTS